MIAKLRTAGLDVKITSRRGDRCVKLRVSQPAIPEHIVEVPVIGTPGLAQEVALRRDDDGHLAWYWVWGEGFRNAGNVEYEKFAKGEDVELAATHIRKVLRVNNFL